LFVHDLKCTCLLIEEYFPGCNHLFEDFTLRQWALKLQGTRKATESVSLKTLLCTNGDGNVRAKGRPQNKSAAEKGRGTDDQLGGTTYLPHKTGDMS
jgi:hypothetical protein